MPAELFLLGRLIITATSTPHAGIERAKTEEDSHTRERQDKIDAFPAIKPSARRPATSGGPKRSIFGSTPEVADEHYSLGHEGNTPRRNVGDPRALFPVEQRNGEVEVNACTADDVYLQ